MSERDESVYVRHMLDAIQRLGRHLEGVDKETFRSSEVLQDAVIRQLEILGEAAGRISLETCAKHPGIPWPKVTGLRHRLIHDYFEVDLNMVWKVATDDVPQVRPLIEALLLALEAEP